MERQTSIGKDETIAIVSKADYKHILCCIPCEDEEILVVNHRITHKASEDLPQIREVVDRINDSVPCYVRMLYENRWVEICTYDDDCTMITRERRGNNNEN